MKKFLMFIFAIVVSFVPGLIGIMFAPVGDNNVWYNSLANSALTPAAWVFPFAWTILYTLLGVALFLVMKDRTRINKSKSYLLFVSNMGLNALWSYVFFGLHMIGAAMIVIVLLLIISFWMKRAFYPISHWASGLVWPYIIWLAFATYLNGVILYMN